MQTLKGRISSVLAQAVDTVLPPRCVVTGDPVEVQGMVAPGAWAALDFIARPFCETCGFPFDFDVTGEGALCASCLADPPSYGRARAALKYNDASRDMILGFKHADKTHAVRAFVPWLRRAGAEMLAQADLLVPVPLHPWRLIARRYNQAALMVQMLAQDIGISYVLDALLRVRATPSQGHLNAKERFKNVKRAFAIHPSRAGDIKGKIIILVDDVYTTGATAQECAQVLLKGGAAQVHVLTLARVVKAGLNQ